MTFSAQGTRLNRRGMETRERILEIAIDCLAGSGPEVPSANLIAHRAGVTWGTIQHQFADTDGLWAAVLDEASRRGGPVVPTTTQTPPSLHHRVELVIEAMWRGYDTPAARAVQKLRELLPGDPAVLAESFPKTAATLQLWDANWLTMWERLFEGVAPSSDKSRRVRNLLPGAVRGLHTQGRLSTYTDVDDGRRGLIDAIALYLQTP